MILVDSSVWIDFFRERETWQTQLVKASLDDEEFLTGDLILAEVLQGTSDERAFRLALSVLANLPMIEIGGVHIAIEAAHNYQTLRGRGITIRATIDTLIATRCIGDGIVLLHNDRDFDPFAEHLGLQASRPQ